MTEERISPLRQRMMEDMRIRGMGDKAQKSHIRPIVLGNKAHELRSAPKCCATNKMLSSRLSRYRQLYRIVAINPNRPKYPIIAERVSDGRGFKFSADNVLVYLKHSNT